MFLSQEHLPRSEATRGLIPPRSHQPDRCIRAQDLNYRYDQAGNVISISDPVTMGGTGKEDHQCFGYDGYQRLIEAWTPATDDCDQRKRTTANLAGAAPYWSSFDYNDAGLRTTETQHSTTGDTVIGYGYDKIRSHQLAQTTTTRPDGTTSTAKYTYDDLGNTRTRPGAQGAQTLTWDAEGNLVSNSEPAKGTVPAKNTNYLYDADGNLLIRRATDGDGDTILYLGATEVRLTAKGAERTLSSTRYYTHTGQTVAVRTATQGTSGSRLSWQAGDHHGTATLSITADTQAVTKRYTTPFGAPRGTSPAWVDDKTFLGKPTDTITRLIHVGAREYDPLLGRFLSVDPVLDTQKPLSLNGYTYAENNPCTLSDPTGLATGGGAAFCNGNPGCIAAATIGNAKTIDREPNASYIPGGNGDYLPVKGYPANSGATGIPGIGETLGPSSPLWTQPCQNPNSPRWTFRSPDAFWEDDSDRPEDPLEDPYAVWVDYGDIEGNALNGLGAGTVIMGGAANPSYKRLGSFLIKSGPGINVLGGLVSADAGYSTARSRGASKPRAVTVAALEGTGGVVLGVGGAYAGAQAGALFGSFIPVPIVGTLVGAAVGAGIGYFGGKYYNKVIESWLL
jgi:RHS repeat-associated protein